MSPHFLRFTHFFSPRPDEINGTSYHFVSKETFSEMVKEGKFLEWANVHDNSYGTSIGAFTAGKSSIWNVISILFEIQIMTRQVRVWIDVSKNLGLSINLVVTSRAIVIISPYVEQIVEMSVYHDWRHFSVWVESIDKSSTNNLSTLSGTVPHCILNQYLQLVGRKCGKIVILEIDVQGNQTNSIGYFFSALI